MPDSDYVTSWNKVLTSKEILILRGDIPLYIELPNGKLKKISWNWFQRTWDRIKNKIIICYYMWWKYR